MRLTIHCRYSCAGCGLADIGVDVPERGDESVAVWMNDTIRLLSRDHARRSPRCHPKSLQEVKIPITGASRIGGSTLQ